jgi:cell division protein FtsI/penicillin-binding protein 2
MDKNLRLWMVVSLAAFVIISARLFYIQVVRHSFWKEKAGKQHVVKQSIQRKRGTIFDRNGNELAYTAAMKKMFCDPSRMKNVEDTLELLASFTKLQVPQLLENIRNARDRGRKYFMIKADVTLAEFDKIRAKLDEERKQLKKPDEVGLLAGVVYFRDSQRRFYPYNMNAANLLGFVGQEGKGLEGIELYYDDLLASRDGLKVYERGLTGIVVPNSEKILREPQGGTSISLTIDIVLQYLAEKKLKEAFEQHRPKSAMIVIQDPANGDVLAMASQPSFNPNFFSFYTPADYKNRVIVDQFEPGSTLKMMVIAAALEENAINLEEMFQCKGYIELYDVFRIHCDQRQVHGNIDPLTILKKSCNVGSIYAAQRLGSRRLYTYLTRFGFGEKTEVALPGEVRGILREPKGWSGISIAAIPIGQEIAINALQMTSAFSAIVNGGILYRPRILTKTRTVEKTEHSITVTPVRRVISEKTAESVMKMLTTVTQVGGSGLRAAIPGYAVAGKTGTAQSLAEMTKAKNDTLEEGNNPKVIASFIGAIPADKPKLVMYVVLNEPQGEKYYGGQIAAPIFRELGTEVLSYLRISPSQGETPTVATTGALPVVPYPELIQLQSYEDAIPDWLNLDMLEYELTPATAWESRDTPVPPGVEDGGSVWE